MDSYLINDNEKVYFGIAVAISALVYLGLVFSIIGIIYLLIGIGVSVFIHGLNLGNIRSNGVKLTFKQFPEVHKKVQELCKEMGIINVPSVYVLESGGLLNAFATRLFGRNFIVLYSDIFEIIKNGNDKELTFVIAHELAHVKRNHMTKNLLILPAMWVPFLGNAYSRACEYTCDRMATHYTQDIFAAEKALTILAVGKEIYDQVDIEEYLHNSASEQGFFIWLSHVMSTHPPLPVRIREIRIKSRLSQSTMSGNGYSATP